MDGAVVLVFDTETTGIPKNWKAPLTDLENWPRLVELAWILCDDGGQKVDDHSAIVRPDGFTIPADAARVHGITTERAVREGEDLRKVLGAFAEAVARAGTLVAHNMSFDEKIVGAELLRTRIPSTFDGKPRTCTMRSSTAFCGLPGKYGPKWPTLEELHVALFGVSPDVSHEAGADAAVCARCFFELRAKGVIR